MKSKCIFVLIMLTMFLIIFQCDEFRTRGAGNMVQLSMHPDTIACPVEQQQFNLTVTLKNTSESSLILIGFMNFYVPVSYMEYHASVNYLGPGFALVLYDQWGKLILAQPYPSTSITPEQTEGAVPSKSKADTFPRSSTRTTTKLGQHRQDILKSRSLLPPQESIQTKLTVNLQEELYYLKAGIYSLRILYSVNLPPLESVLHITKDDLVEANGEAATLFLGMTSSEKITLILE